MGFYKNIVFMTKAVIKKVMGYFYFFKQTALFLSLQKNPFNFYLFKKKIYGDSVKKITVK